MYSSTLKRVEERLTEVEFVAITTDLWTSVTNTDFMSITVHYLDKEFVYQHLYLEETAFPEVSRTGENICKFICSLLNQRDLSSMVVILMQHTSCLANTLQLVVKDAVLTNKIVNIISTCRKLVGHIKDSANATKVRKAVKIQQLIQEEPTRWNTTLYMLKRLHEQKRAILLANAELNCPTQWTLIENIIPILDVFDSITKHINSNNVNASEVSTEHLGIPIAYVVIVEESDSCGQRSFIRLFVFLFPLQTMKHFVFSLHPKKCHSGESYEVKGNSGVKDAHSKFDLLLNKAYQNQYQWVQISKGLSIICDYQIKYDFLTWKSIVCSQLPP
ncbi:hypothetical protein PR048_012525 [Dryococelus australis]|uniref:Zinc finger BED domain-containing protein 4 n=1 Tax=Dryococelus australis TaxID=614101 RepID=A0ABQ9HQB8_9NEOP|nr:hypothetical protein PR048_012525 [Dryococelus australis]